MKVKLDPGAVVKRAHPLDAGLDLCAMEDGWILPKCRKTFDTGFHAMINPHCAGFVTSKSGLMSKGITARGTIDTGFTGSIKAVLFNHSWKPIRIKKGQKIAQLVILPIIIPELEEVDELDETERGDNGFGSSGKF